jgi:hypothetical protein
MEVDNSSSVISFLVFHCFIDNINDLLCKVFILFIRGFYLLVIRIGLYVSVTRHVHSPQGVRRLFLRFNIFY